MYMEIIEVDPPIKLNPQVDIAYNKFTTEQELLDMSRHFKELLEDKNIQIKKLTKLVTVTYGVLNFGEIIEDGSSSIFLREWLEGEMEKLLGLED